MNESLAKQLHDLVGNWKESIASNASAHVKQDFDMMQNQIKKLIESNQNQEKLNKNT